MRISLRIAHYCCISIWPFISRSLLPLSPYEFRFRTKTALEHETFRESTAPRGSWVAAQRDEDSVAPFSVNSGLSGAERREALERILHVDQPANFAPTDPKPASNSAGSGLTVVVAVATARRAMQLSSAYLNSMRVYGSSLRIAHSGLSEGSSHSVSVVCCVRLSANCFIPQSQLCTTARAKDADSPGSSIHERLPMSQSGEQPLERSFPLSYSVFSVRRRLTR